VLLPLRSEFGDFLAGDGEEVGADGLAVEAVDGLTLVASVFPVVVGADAALPRAIALPLLVPGDVWGAADVAVAQLDVAAHGPLSV